MRLNGAAIRVIRERSGLSISEAARRAGVRQPTWSNWERNRRNATPGHVAAICAVLRIDDVTAILADPSEEGDNDEQAVA
jgi:transcriptional regulator with XRE-family HTH domain